MSELREDATHGNPVHTSEPRLLVDADFLVSQKLAKEKLAIALEKMIEPDCELGFCEFCDNRRRDAERIRQADLTDCRVETDGEFSRRPENAGLPAHVYAQVESLSAQVAELKTNARRYEYWRDCGICIGDAPASYVFLEELDKFTDQAIKESGSG